MRTTLSVCVCVGWGWRSRRGGRSHPHDTNTPNFVLGRQQTEMKRKMSCVGKFCFPQPLHPKTGQPGKAEWAKYTRDKHGVIRDKSSNGKQAEADEAGRSTPHTRTNKQQHQAKQPTGREQERKKSKTLQNAPGEEHWLWPQCAVSRTDETAHPLHTATSLGRSSILMVVVVFGCGGKVPVSRLELVGFARALGL